MCKKLNILFTLIIFSNCSEINTTDLVEPDCINKDTVTCNKENTQYRESKSLLMSKEDISSVHPIILPGAPGEASQTIDPITATNIASTSYVKADVSFLQAMIVHHKQAIIMSKLAGKRTNNKIIIDLANRIDSSQEDEIKFMENWLESREEKISFKSEHHHKHMDMVGMATAKELEELKESESTDFDKLFIQLMIAHHDGCLLYTSDAADE